MKEYHRLIGTVTFFILTFFIRKVYTDCLNMGQSLYGTKFIRDKVYTGTKFIQGQSLYRDKVYTGTKFIRGQSLSWDRGYTGQSLYNFTKTTKGDINLTYSISLYGIGFETFPYRT